MRRAHVVSRRLRLAVKAAPASAPAPAPAPAFDRRSRTAVCNTDLRARCIASVSDPISKRFVSSSGGSGSGSGSNSNSISNINKDDNSDKDGAATTAPAVTTSLPISFATASRISGQESQTLEVVLRPGQRLRAEAGAMLYMTGGVQMNTTMAEGGVSGGLKRMLTGQNMFLADYTYDGTHGEAGTVALGTDFPSKILRLSLEEYGGKIVCQKGAYLASSDTVDIDIEFAKKLTAGFFGGEGFVLQSIVGEGDVFVKAGGTLVRRDLREGETLRVSSGSLVAMTSSVEFDVGMMKGVKNIMFSGEGLFVTTLTGPGTVWLQGMPPDRFISEIARRVPSGGGIGLGIPIGGGISGDGASDAGDAGDEVPETGALGSSVDEASDDMDQVAASDTAVGDSIGDTANIDSDSPSALFGDAAPTNEADATPPSSGMEDAFVENDTSFSTDDALAKEEFGDFFDDGSTEFSTTEDNASQDAFGEDETEHFDTGDYGDSGGEGGGDEGGGIMESIKSIWDFFNEDE